jgi:hypothetical protein
VSALAEKSFEQFLGSSPTGFAHDHGFALTRRIADESFVVEPSQRIPIESLPRSAIVQPEMEQCQNRVIDLVLVQLHSSLSILVLATDNVAG